MRTILRLELTIGELPEVPADLEIITFSANKHEDRWLKLNNQIFTHHPDQGGWQPEDLTNRMAETWFDPNGFFIATHISTHEDQWIGFVWTKIHHTLARTGPVGEIYVIGVDPDHAGQGLGRALLIKGLTHIKSLGINEAMLYVDADNERALKMYRALGFN